MTMMVQYRDDRRPPTFRPSALVRVAIANWENEGGAILPVAGKSERERPKRAKHPELLSCAVGGH